MVYRKCTVCGNKVPQYTQCVCEKKKRLDNYRDYQERKMLSEEEKEMTEFYQSKEWEKCREIVAGHQYNLDLIEWSKGYVRQAELYHHVIEAKEDTDGRLDIYNIIGLTQANHNTVHAIMKRGPKEKKELQNRLMDILDRFEKEYYD